MAVASLTRLRRLRGGLLALGVLLSWDAHPLEVVIANGTNQIYLRVGAAGALTTVTFTVPASTAGTGVPVVGTANAAAGAVQLPNFPVVCPANHVRIVARARSTPAGSRTATLRVNSSINLTSGGNSIPLTDFDWISTDPEVPTGAFSGSTTQFLYSFQNSREVSVCHQFRFLNSNVYPPGNYTGTFTYNLNMP